MTAGSAASPPRCAVACCVGARARRPDGQRRCGQCTCGPHGGSLSDGCLSQTRVRRPGRRIRRSAKTAQLRRQTTVHEGRGRRTVRHPELAVGVLEVLADGRLAHHQLGRDVVVRPARRHQRQDAPFGPGQCTQPVDARRRPEQPSQQAAPTCSAPARPGHRTCGGCGRGTSAPPVPDRAGTRRARCPGCPACAGAARPRRSRRAPRRAGCRSVSGPSHTCGSKSAPTSLGIDTAYSTQPVPSATPIPSQSLGMSRDMVARTARPALPLVRVSVDDQQLSDTRDVAPGQAQLVHPLLPRPACHVSKEPTTGGMARTDQPVAPERTPTQLG